MSGATASAALQASVFCTFQTLLPSIPVPQELAKFQAFLQKQGATQLSDMVRGRQRLAYPIKR